MDSVKNILQSKTLWLNILGPVFLWLGGKGIQLDPETQGAVVLVVMSIANIIMRRLTSVPVQVMPVKK